VGRTLLSYENPAGEGRKGTGMQGPAKEHQRTFGKIVMAQKYLNGGEDLKGFPQEGYQRNVRARDLKH